MQTNRYSKFFRGFQDHRAADECVYNNDTYCNNQCNEDDEHRVNNGHQHSTASVCSMQKRQNKCCKSIIERSKPSAFRVPRLGSQACSFCSRNEDEFGNLNNCLLKSDTVNNCQRYSNFFTSGRDMIAKHHNSFGKLSISACNGNNPESNVIRIIENRVGPPDDAPRPEYTLLRNQRVRAQTEPRVAKHPFNPNKIIVAQYTSEESSVYQLAPTTGTIQFNRSVDGGKTFVQLSSRPSIGALQNHSYHYSIGWGPGPVQGSDRLYACILLGIFRTGTFADALGRYALSYSDDSGDTWSDYIFIDPLGLGLSNGQPSGGIPELVVDNNPRSCNYGNVYITYNYQLWDDRYFEFGVYYRQSAKFLWSRNFGVSFDSVEIDPVPVNHIALPAGTTLNGDFSLPDLTRPAVAPNGDVFVFSGQPVRYSLPGEPFPNVFSFRQLFISQRFAVPTGGTVIKYQPVLVRDIPDPDFPAPAPGIPSDFYLLASFSHQIEINQQTGAIYVLMHYYDGEQVSSPRGRIFVHRSRNHGKTYHQIDINTSVPGHSSVRPLLRISAEGKKFLLNFTVFNDLPQDTTQSAVVCQFLVHSNDGGHKWGDPILLNEPNTLSQTSPEYGYFAMAISLFDLHNGGGLRTNDMLFLNNTEAILVYPDARNASLDENNLNYGNSDIYSSLIFLKDCDETDEEQDGCSWKSPQDECEAIVCKTSSLHCNTAKLKRKCAWPGCDTDKC